MPPGRPGPRLLVTRAADLYAADLNAVNADGVRQNALEGYGHHKPSLAPAVKEERRALLQHADDEGPYPNIRSLGSSQELRVGDGLLRLLAPARETAHPAISEPPAPARRVNSTHNHLDRGSAACFSEHGGVRTRLPMDDHRLVHLSTTLASLSYQRATI